jgi:hypothetical protein
MFTLTIWLGVPVSALCCKVCPPLVPGTLGREEEVLLPLPSTEGETEAQGAALSGATQ